MLDSSGVHGLTAISLALEETAGVSQISDSHLDIIVDEMIAVGILKKNGGGTFVIATSQPAQIESQVEEEGRAEEAPKDVEDRLMTAVVQSPKIDRPKVRYGLTQKTLDLLFRIFVAMGNKEFHSGDIPWWNTLEQKARMSVWNAFAATKMIKKAGRGTYQFDVAKIPIEWAKVLEGFARAKSAAVAVANHHDEVLPLPEPVMPEPPVAPVPVPEKTPVPVAAPVLPPPLPKKVDMSLLIAAAPIYRQYFEVLPYEAQLEVLEGLRSLIEHNKR